MPCKSIGDLPARVRQNLPEHAQEIYLKAFNNAWDEYANPKDRRGKASREEIAHKVAWSAVEQVYEKNGKSGRWRKKSSYH